MKTTAQVLIATIMAWASMTTNTMSDTLLLCPGSTAPNYGGCDPYTTFNSGSVSTVTFWVVAYSDGASAAGFSQFDAYIEGLEGLPSYWNVQVTPASPGVMTGDFVSPRLVGATGIERGGSITYPECQAGDLLPILQVVLLGVGATQDVARNTEIRVGPTYPAISSELACPVLTLCDSPAFTKVCVTAERMVINSDVLRCPPVAVETSTWSEVKALFH